MKKLFCRLSLTLFLVPCISFAQLAVEHGDLNCDGTVNVLDAVMEIDRIMNQDWGDADDDGIIDVFEDHCYDHFVEGMASDPGDLQQAFADGFEDGFTEGYDNGYWEGVESVEEAINCFQSGFCAQAGAIVGGDPWYSQNQHASFEDCMSAGENYMQQYSLGGDFGISLAGQGAPAEYYLEYLCTSDSNFGD